MEEQSSELKFGGVTFISQHNSSSYTNGKPKKMNWNRAEKNLRITSNGNGNGNGNGGFCSYNNESPESTGSLTGAMEYLCRPWSPSASDFLHTSFPSQNLLASNINDRTEDYKEEHEDEEALSKRGIANKRNNIRMELNHMKGWLKLGKSLPSFLRMRREKKKEETRFHMAKLHAALSVTQLAAAMANFTTSHSSSGSPDTNSTKLVTAAQEQAALGIAFTSAAALMTAIWAEVAESLGAPKVQVASAINSGLAITSRVDMIAVTATAATSLRGAAALKSRFMEEASYFPRSQEMLKAGAQICIIMPSGHREHKWVTIYLKHKELILSFRKKYLGGALTTSKEYKAINIIEENKKGDQGEGNLFIRLKTNKGIMKLLFEDEKQSTIWISTISTLLNTPHCIN